MFSSPGCPGESGGPSELRVLGAIGRHFVELAWLGGRRAWGRLDEAGWCVSLQVLGGGHSCDVEITITRAGVH